MISANSNLKDRLETSGAAGSGHHIEEVIKMLKELRLSAMAEGLHVCMDNPQFHELGLYDQLYELLSYESTRRSNRSYDRLKKQASLFSSATCETITKRKQAYHLTQTRIDYLTSCQWRERGVVLLIVGKCGCGKTDLACAIVDSACRKKLKSKCVDFDTLILELVSARKKADGAELYQARLKSYLKYDILFIDDICMEPAIDGAAYVFKDLLELFRKEGANKGLILASQLKPAKWFNRLGGTKETSDAVVDRVLSNYELISLDGRSHRSGRPNNAEQGNDDSQTEVNHEEQSE